MIIAALVYQMLMWFRQHAMSFMDLILFNPYKIPIRSITFTLQMGTLRL